MSDVHLEGENEGILVKGRGKIKFHLDILARELVRGIRYFDTKGYQLQMISPKEVDFKEPVNISDFYNEVLSYENLSLCERADIYLATRNGLEIETEMEQGFVSLAIRPALCMDKKWRILTLQRDFKGDYLIEGLTCHHKVQIERKFIFRTYQY